MNASAVFDVVAPARFPSPRTTEQPYAQHV